MASRLCFSMMGTISFSTNSRAVWRTSFSSSFSCESKSMKSTPEYLAMLRSFCWWPSIQSRPAFAKSFRGFFPGVPATFRRHGFRREILAGAVPNATQTVSALCLKFYQGFEECGSKQTVEDYSLLRRLSGALAGGSYGSLFFEAFSLGNQAVSLFTGVRNNLLAF